MDSGENDDSASFDALPNEIKAHIVDFLDDQSLVRTSEVSRNLNGIVTSFFFSDRLNHAKFRARKRKAMKALKAVFTLLKNVKKTQEETITFWRQDAIDEGEKKISKKKWQAIKKQFEGLHTAYTSNLDKVATEVNTAFDEVREAVNELTNDDKERENLLAEFQNERNTLVGDISVYRINVSQLFQNIDNYLNGILR